MPKLQQMQGTLNLTETGTNNIQSVCSHFSGLGVIGGNVQCANVQATSSSTGSSAQSTGTGNAAGHYSASPETVFSVFGGLAALFGLLM